ncbi:MFS transporter [Rhizosaccharibacter radicis]|uniref:MFS transporter n=1 Tax=Rhizosaccharibacter radicis TaxID=2782605 RepID=A0ABT1VT75_9PROT|nr:MFS transporter [Acetobacteraceae bacterium KSS12]
MTPPPAPDGEPDWTPRGSRGYRRIVLALFLSGYATFSLLYCVQPLLPVFSEAFRIGPARSALALSLTTGLLAPAILLASAASDAVGRRGLMAASLFAAAAACLLSAFAPTWPSFLATRALGGLLLGGAPALAMTFLAEEIHPHDLGRAMGLYVSGTAMGGMAGRVLTGVAADLFGWRAALVVVGALGLCSAIGFLWLLPRSRNFRRRDNMALGEHLRLWGAHLRAPELQPLFVYGAMLMGGFVTLYNYAGYRLAAPPYDLSQTVLGALFTLYLLGSVSSAAAGHLAVRFGRRPLLLGSLMLAAAGIVLSLARPLPVLMAGIALFTVAFFAGHAVASASVGRLARGAKGHASALYLLHYYLGSSILGVLGGSVWHHAGWGGLVGFIVLMLALAAAGLPRVPAG